MITSPDNYFAKYISVAACAALKITILIVPVNWLYDTDLGSQATYQNGHKIAFSPWRKWIRNVEYDSKNFCENFTNRIIFSLFKRVHLTRTRKRKRKINLISKRKKTFFYLDFFSIATLKNKDNDFLCQLCFLSLYLFWLTTCIFDLFYLRTYVTIMNW